MPWEHFTKTTFRTLLFLAASCATVALGPWAPTTATESVSLTLPMPQPDAERIETRRAQPASMAWRRARPVVTRRSAPLSEADAARYRQIFHLQQQGEFAAADALIARLGERSLLGHVLWQRYMHPTAWRSSFEELAGWLEHYADHPGADRIYSLALRRRPAGAAAPARPVRGYLGGAGQEGLERVRIDYRPALDRTPVEEAAVRAWLERIEQLVGAGRAAEAEALLRQPGIEAPIDPIETDLARWTVARGHLSGAEPTRALALAGRAAARSGGVAPEIHWTAGLSAWHLARIELAGRHFAALADAAEAAPAERARAAFWAARAYVVTFRPQLVTKYLRLAAEGSDFYGLLARAVLGDRPAAPPLEADFEARRAEVLLRFPGARRALALGQVGELERAEQEIRKLAGRASPELMVGLIALATSLDLPAAQMRLAQSLRSSRGQQHLSALYPLPSWRPADGYKVDRALIYAIIRAESAFDPGALSHAGARGLMQVMPATAVYIASRAALEVPRKDELFEPETSIRFGQAYLAHLLQRPPIDGNLILLAAAYNAGPGNVARWRERPGIAHDPLLFLEAIPIRETRDYVKKVLTNLWSYRARLGQPQPSLEALARNEWPGYRALDRGPQIHAWN
jgi:soluble lytic murein transglycosylase-like protein